MSEIRNQRLSVHWSILLIGFLLACSQQVEDVNRIQPYYIKKSHLEGQWYYRQMLTESPPTGAAGLLFEGLHGEVEKIRFEFRERQLIAYRVHPNVEGLEDDRIIEGSTYQGEPVAVFAIQSHFDIMRDFDTTTGEQSNVLRENTSLKPWFDREYVRVNWSSNIIESQVDVGGIFNLLGQSTYYARDHEPYNPDRLIIEDDYISFTSHYSISDGGYACLTQFGSPSGAGGYGNCGSVEVGVRSSLMRIDPEETRQFETLSYNDSERILDEDGNPIRVVTATVGAGADTVDLQCTDEVLEKLGPRYGSEDCRFLTWDQMGRFGFFRSERVAYDRRVGGNHDLGRQHYANYHQFWKETRRSDNTTIPLSEREVRPIVYYINANFPEDLKETAAKMGANWDDVFMQAAMAATGKSETAIRAQLAADADSDAVYLETDDRKGSALFQIRENNCSIAGVELYLAENPEMNDVLLGATRFEGLKPGNLKRVCSGLNFFAAERQARPFNWQQMGDLRYSFLWWVNDEQMPGLLGFGPSSTDVETGRNLSGNAFVYGTQIDQFARNFADQLRAMNGDDPLTDILDGESLRRWMARGSDAASMPMAPTAEMQAMVSERIGTPYMEGDQNFRRDDGQFDMGKMFNHMHNRLAQPVPNDPVNRAMTRPHDRKQIFLEAVADDPQMAARFTDPEMMKLAGVIHGWKPGMDKPEGLDKTALELSVDPHSMHKHTHARHKFFEERNMYTAEFLDDSILGKAEDFKGMTAEEVFQTVRREIFEAVALHEIGHTVGLRHNFGGSFDALNYRKEFWEIRRDRPEEEWVEARLPEYRYASIMDYGARFNSDNKGLGRYDFAAIKFLYGRHLEEFENDVPVPGHFAKTIKVTDYSRLPELLGGDLENLWKRKNVSIDDSMSKAVNRLASNTSEFLGESGKPYVHDRTVPYEFCHDTFNGDLRCKTRDEGSNHTEAVQSAIQRYWSYYALNSFRRGRDEGRFINSFFGNISRLMDYLVYPWQFYYFYDAYPVDVRDDLLRASILGLNFINEVVGTPEPGEYCEYITAIGTDANGEEGGECIASSDCAEGSVCRSRQCVLEPNVYLPSYYFSAAYQNACRKAQVGLAEGRDQFFNFSPDHLYKIDYIGSYFEKSNVLSALFMDQSRFFRVTDESDTRRFTVGYYRAFREEVLKMVRDLLLGTLVNGSISNDSVDFLTDSVHARVVNPDGTLRAQPLIDSDRFDTADRATAFRGPQLYTPVPFNLATRAVDLAMIYNTTSYDEELDLIEYLNVSELGSGDDRVTDGRDQVVFVNPITGQAYVATQTWDGRSISYELLERLNVFVENDWAPAKAEFEANPTNENAREFYDRMDRQMNEFIEMVDNIREMRSLMDFGQGGGWR